MEKNTVLKQIRPCDLDEPFVFVSYSSKDSARVWEDVLHFQKLGYNVWLDEKNLDKTKQSWRLDALEAIRDINCALVVFYVSRHSLVSQACFAELQCTVEETTQATHNGPVKFVAVDAEPIDDIIQFQQEIYGQVRSNREISKEEETGRLLTLRKCIEQFFDSNNEKVRVKAMGLPNRKMDYYEEIVAAFPDDSRILLEEATPAQPEKAIAQKKEEKPLPVYKPRPFEIKEMPFDFLEDIRLKFEKNFKKETNTDEENLKPEIPLAVARLERQPYEQNFTIVDTNGFQTQVYLIEPFMIPSKDRWIWSNKLRLLPFTQTMDGKGRPKRTFLLEGDRFAREDHNVVLLSIHEDRSKTLLNLGLLSHDHKLYVSRRPSTVHPWELDEFGYHKDSGMEELFAFCDIGNTDDSDFWQPVCWRRSVSQYKPEYLRYLILDMRNMEEIPKTFGRSADGAYQLSVVLPCPGRFVIVQVTDNGPEFAEVKDAVAGHLYGAYGLKKKPAVAERLMREKAEEADPAMTFEYGAYLRKEGKTEEAEKYLRLAAQLDVDGAKFELAELLLEKSAQDDSVKAEIRLLIDDLWEKGRRTYGSEQTIDLLGEHPQADA